MPQRGVVELDLAADRCCARGVDVRGTVVGEDGKPVAGAEVEAIWHRRGTWHQSSLARTDRAGAFTLHGVDPLAELSLTAWDGFASTPTATVRAESAAQPAHRPDHQPQEHDAHRRPGRRPRRQADRRRVGPDLAAGPGQARARIVCDPIAGTDHSIRLRTDAEGRYRTPRRFPAHAAYYAEAAAPGRLVGPLARRSPWCPRARQAVGPGAPRACGTVEGRVVDRRGQPVAGAVVRQSGDGPMPTEILTAADGRFQLPGVLEGPA